MSTKQKKETVKRKSDKESSWKRITSSIGYALFILLLVYITYIISRKIGLNLGICPFILPGCK